MLRPALTRVHARAARHRVAAALTLLTALVALVCLPGSSASAAGEPTDGSTAVDTPVAGVTTTRSDGLVVVGVGGLYWSDIDRIGTPTLWRMITEGSVASISVRTANVKTCPYDAWSTLSAGRRMPASTPEATPETPADVDGTALASTECLTLPEVISTGSGDTPAPAQVSGWSGLAVESEEPAGAYGTLGTVGDRIGAQAACSTAVGPGAALALADASGQVGRYVADLSGLDEDELVACPVTFIDAGSIASGASDRPDSLQELDGVLRDLVATVPAGWRIVVAGISGTPEERPGLQVVVEWRRGGGTAGWLSSDSTRRPGIVMLADLSATALDTVGAATDDLDGAPLVVEGERRMSTVRTVENRRYLAEMSSTVTHLMPVFVGVLALAVVCAFVVVLMARRRARTADDDGDPAAATPGPATRRAVAAILLLAACAPAGAYLAALSRWWGTSAPTVAAAWWNTVGVVAVALVAWILARLLPPGRWRFATATAGLTWLVLTVDGVTGTVLQQGAILGATPTLGARFYGFGNTAFAVYAASALVLAGAVAATALERGRRRAAISAVVAIGIVSVAVDGWPAFGADFGGVLALVPAFTVLALGVVGAAVTTRRVLLTGLGTALLIVVVAVVDWARPGPSSHLGLFVQRVIDGEALEVVAGKAAGAWATVAHPLGAPATVLCIAVALLTVGPARWRPPLVDHAYRTWPLLQRVVTSLVVLATLGSLLNDSGVAVAASVLGVSVGALAASWCLDAWHPLPGSSGPEPAAPPVTRMPAVLVATGGGLLAALLLGAAILPGPATTAGDVTSGSGSLVVEDGDRVVVVGTSGVRWQDVTPATTPTLWRMLREGAAAGGVTAGVTGSSATCPSAGWLSLSSGRSPVTGVQVDGTWSCTPWAVDAAAAGGGATVTGWDALVDQQESSAFHARLGVLGDTFADAGACTTAVGPGAALALAGAEGRVDRYATVDEALADPNGTYSCPVTVVDAGSVPYHPDPSAVPGTTAVGADRDTALRTLDATVRRVLAGIPSDAVVMVVDVGNPAPGRPSLGVGVVDVGETSAPHFLSATSTRWQGVVRLLDVPTSMLATVGLTNPPELTGSPISLSGTRPSDVAVTVDQLGELSVRDLTLRGVSGPVTSVPLVLALVLCAGALWLGPRLARRPRTADRARALLDVVMLVLASIPLGLFLMTTWSWWRAASPGVGMWVSLVGATATVAGLAALVPRRPIWSGVALISGLTAVVLSVDAVLGTPLHRGSPLGPSPTLGGRYYGFGNPTYSVYVVATMVGAAALATWLLRRGQRRLAVVVTAAITAVALVIDVWPAFGADVGGGLVLVPVGGIVVLAVAGIRVTWQRLAAIGAAGVLVVAVIGVLDWARGPGERSHLGLFVQSVIDGTAADTVLRKGGYAAQTVTSGFVAWLTLALVVATAWLLWRGHRRVRWHARVLGAWALVDAVLLSLLVGAVAGGLINDYGVRVATMMAFAAVPVVAVLALRAYRPTTLPGYEPEPAEESKVTDG